MSSADRSRRYRERQKALLLAAAWTPEATVIMGILSALCDIAGVVTRSALGSWSPNVNPVERTAQLRSLAALAAVFVGSNHRLIAELRAAETDRDAAERALALLDVLPSLTRRRLIATFGAMTFRPRSTKGSTS
jgi:hypothetical protein